MNLQRAAAFAFTGAILLCATASATPINTAGGGLFNFSNLSVNVTSSCINFFNATPGACGTAATLTVNAPSDPALFVMNGTGTINDIVAPPMTGFINTPTVTFDLLGFVPPSGPACVPSSTGICTVAGSPFEFNINANNPTLIGVTLATNLCAYLTGTSAGAGCSTGTAYTGIFTSQSSGSTLSALLAAAITPGGATVGSVSAALSPTPGVPEPASMLLCGMGLIGVAVTMRKTRKA